MSEDHEADCACCNNPDFSWDKFYKEVSENIEKYDCHLTGVFDADVPFTYTTGLITKGLPDLILTGMDMRQAAPLLNLIVQLAIKKEVELKDGHIIRLEEYNNLPIAFVKVSKEEKDERMGVTDNYLKGLPFEALQVVWSDTDGKFPWNDGFEERFREHLPLLGEWNETQKA